MARERYPSSLRFLTLIGASSFMLSVWLPWILTAAVVVIGVPLLALVADDHPRSDDPPDTADEDRDPGPSVLPIAA